VDERFPIAVPDLAVAAQLPDQDRAAS